MKKGYMLKSIIGVYSVLILVMTVYSVLPLNVNAATCYSPSDVVANSGFDIDFKRDGAGKAIENQYVLSMGKGSGSQNYGVTFSVSIVKVNGANGGNDIQHSEVVRSLGSISYGNEITIYANDNDYTNGETLAVFLEGSCTADDGARSEYSSYLMADKVGSGMVTDGGECVQASSATMTQNPLDCTGYDPNGTSFKDKFCNAKNKAPSDKKFEFASESNYFKTYGAGSFIEYKCESDINKIPENFNELVKNDPEAYYLNKGYAYGTSKYTQDVTYTYNYAPSDQGTSSTSCEITCEEAVEAEYGPPVASKAGMCFEYKVRVTSRVSCYMSKALEPPECPKGFCTPRAACTNGTSTWVQAGPNDDFDACVQKCDKGQYSRYCSNKCYKQVYGKSLPAAKLNVAISSTPPYFTEENEFIRLHNGRFTEDGNVLDKYNDISNYYYDKVNGVISWNGPSATVGEMIPGRFYYESNWTRGSTGDFNHYIRDGAGFFRAQYANGSICQDKCSWHGCDGDVYLNPGQDQIDYKENLEKYEEALKACQGQATCSTTTAEVSISADYINKKTNETVTINFPSSRPSDQVTPGADGAVNYPTDDESILLPNDPTEGNGMLGCYSKNDSATNLYRLTWSFPGTWINNKSGEISYKRQDSCDTAGQTCTWREMKQKFCLPNNTGRVNANWWNAYYRKLIDNKGIQTSTTNTEVLDECRSVEYQTITNPGSSTSPEKYNIHAKAVKFGYFSWNIKMDCFYATNPSPLTTTSTSETPKDICKTDPDNYRIRSIDLENVFPKVDGSDTTDKTSYGRLPGHNWTEYSNPAATNGNYNNPDYFKETPNPIDYLGKIQQAAETLYDDKNNIEYQFILSPKNIRNIRRKYVGDAASDKFADFKDGEFYMDKNGVARYFSNAIRSSDANAVAINSNKSGGLTCNNMKGHTDQCE